MPRPNQTAHSTYELDRHHVNQYREGYSPYTPADLDLVLGDFLRVVNGNVSQTCAKPGARTANSPQSWPAALVVFVRFTSWVWTLLSTLCLNYANGLQALLDAIEFYEGDSLPMQQLKQVSALGLGKA